MALLAADGTLVRRLLPLIAAFGRTAGSGSGILSDMGPAPAGVLVPGRAFPRRHCDRLCDRGWITSPVLLEIEAADVRHRATEEKEREREIEREREEREKERERRALSLRRRGSRAPILPWAPGIGPHLPGTKRRICLRARAPQKSPA